MTHAEAIVSLAQCPLSRRGSRTAPIDPSHWKAPSVAAASGALPGAIEAHSENAKLLLVLLCFLASSKVPIYLLHGGASPRRRWNDHGEFEEASAAHVGLHSELVDLLSSIAELDSTLCELMSISAISENSDQTYTLNRAVQDHVSNYLPPELHSFWRLQALIAAYRSIPWKYIESE